MMSTTIHPFQVAWADAERASVMRRVADYELPPTINGEDWSLGCSAEFLARLKTHWQRYFDWNEATRLLNRYPQFLTEIDNVGIHFVRVAAEVPNAPPLMLIHGWPSAHFEFWDAIDRLTHPSRFGGEAADAVELIIPSIPGFGFSGKPEQIIGPRAVAHLFDKLMVERLGYSRYLSHGGDWGAMVTSWLGIDHADHVAGIHLGMIALPQPARAENAEDVAWMSRFAATQHALGAYSHLQGTKPQSLAWLAAGNPMGQAAWIIERLHDWSDARERPFEAIFDLDWILTLITIYVMTDSFRSASYLYYGRSLESGGGSTNLLAGGRCDVPTAFTYPVGDPRVAPPPRVRVEAMYNIVRWREASRGGHFLAKEYPQNFADDLLDWRRTAWR
jgi:pimeloyl-ACP methyl ester carboxylesterase